MRRRQGRPVGCESVVTYCYIPFNIVRHRYRRAGGDPRGGAVTQPRVAVTVEGIDHKGLLAARGAHLRPLATKDARRHVRCARRHAHRERGAFDRHTLAPDVKEVASRVARRVAASVATVAQIRNRREPVAARGVSVEIGIL